MRRRTRIGTDNWPQLRTAVKASCELTVPRRRDVWSPPNRRGREGPAKATETAELEKKKNEVQGLRQHEA